MEVFFYPNELWNHEDPDRVMIFEKRDGSCGLIGSLRLETAVSIHGFRPFLTRNEYLTWTEGE